MKNDTVIVLVSKPREVDSLLERRMSVWVMKDPTGVTFLRYGQWFVNGDGEGTNAVDKGHVRQQRLSKGCVAADAIGCMTGIKAILNLYDVHDTSLRLDEQFHVTVCELRQVVRARNVSVRMRLTSSYGTNNSKSVPVFTHASRHTITAQSAFI